jgi:hypothetical protein
MKATGGKSDQVAPCSDDIITIMGLRFYHRTAAAEAIIRDGFRDNNGLAGAHYAGIKGVFLSDIPLDWNQGTKGDQLLEVTLPLACAFDISEYELIEEDGPLYREWCVPSDIINRNGTVRLLNEEEAEEAEEEGSKEKWRRYKLVSQG